MGSIRRRAVVALPSADEFNQPVIGFDYKYDVSILSPIHQQIFRPTSLQQCNMFVSRMGASDGNIPPTAFSPRRSFIFRSKRSVIQPWVPRLSLQKVVDETHFSKNEVRAIYRAFKETSPNAVINKEILREKFAELFPQGDIEHYADLLFDTFDNDRNGSINFLEFVKALSVLCRGTLDEKLEWLYRLYDPKNTGEVTIHRLYYVITSMDDLMGRKARPMYTQEQKANRATMIFQKFDVGRKGKITKEDFIRVCKSDRVICQSIAALYTILPG